MGHIGVPVQPDSRLRLRQRRPRAEAPAGPERFRPRPPSGMYRVCTPETTPGRSGCLSAAPQWPDTRPPTHRTRGTGCAVGALLLGRSRLCAGRGSALCVQEFDTDCIRQEHLPAGLSPAAARLVRTRGRSGEGSGRPSRNCRSATCVIPSAVSRSWVCAGEADVAVPAGNSERRRSYHVRRAAERSSKLLVAVAIRRPQARNPEAACPRRRGGQLTLAASVRQPQVTSTGTFWRARRAGESVTSLHIECYLIC